MNLETFFTNEDIKDIYETITLYSIIKYQNLPEPWKEMFKEKYKNALKNKLNIITNNKEESIESLHTTLQNYQKLYNQLLEQNKNIIKLSSKQIERKIIETINKIPTEKEKVTFLFEFLTTYLTYSEDYFNYCLQVPPIDGFEFDFKNNIPVDSSVEGMLVIGQGLCDDISNLMIYLGRMLGLQIGKVFTNYNGNSHSLNSIILDNQTYLIDATRKIRKDKTTKECFLVSTTTLNKDGNYIFENYKNETSDYQHNLSNYEKEVENLIKEIQKYRPQQIDLNFNQTKSLTK